jgi:FMN phosphatase YigB (HAD superfamily)
MAKLLTHLRAKYLRPTLRELMVFYGGRLPVAQKVVRRLRPGLEFLPAGAALRIHATADFAKHVERFDSISLDVFDTLVFRVHRDPELIKPRVSHYVSLLLNQAGVEHDPAGVEDMRRLIEWHLCSKHAELGHDPECTLIEISEAFFQAYRAENPKCLSEKWLDYELLAEQSWIEVPDGVKGLLEQLKQTGKKIFYLSDMYMTEEAVEAILEEKGIRHYADELLVSGSRRIGKYSGNQFRYLQDKHGVNLSKHIHVGDSMRSDVLGPLQVGATGVWLMDWKPDTRPTGTFQDVVKAWTEEQKALNPRLSHEGYRIGFEILGPSYFAYTAHMLDEAVRARASVVMCLAREGDLFKWIAEHIWEHAPRFKAFARPRIEYALISRGSCAPAAMHGFSDEEIAIAKIRKPAFNLTRFAQTFRMPEDEVRQFAWKHFIRMEEGLRSKDIRLQNLKDDEEFQLYCARHGETHRSLLRDYLASLGVTENSGTVMISDMGWSGTMQHLIKLAFQYETMPRFVGSYYGMHWNANYNFSGGESRIKPGFIMDSRQDNETAMAFHPLKPLLEIAATARHGSTSHYERKPDGSVEAILSEPKEDFADGRIEIQDGLRDFVSKFVEVYALYEWPPHMMKPYAQHLMISQLLTPTRQVATTVGRLTQSVDWGSEERVSIVNPNAKPGMILRPRKFRRYVHESIWHVGAMRQMGVTQKQYGMVIRGLNVLRKILRVLRIKR